LFAEELASDGAAILKVANTNPTRKRGNRPENSQCGECLVGAFG